MKSSLSSRWFVSLTAEPKRRRKREILQAIGLADCEPYFTTVRIDLGRGRSALYCPRLLYRARSGKTADHPATEEHHRHRPRSTTGRRSPRQRGVDALATSLTTAGTGVLHRPQDEPVVVLGLDREVGKRL